MRRIAFTPLQTAIFQHLNKDTALNEKINGILDRTVTNTSPPYITLTNFRLRRWKTKVSRASRITFAIQTWSAYDGYAETYQLMELVEQALTSGKVYMDSGFEGHFEIEDMDVFKEADGELRRGLMQVSAFLMQK